MLSYTISFRLNAYFSSIYLSDIAYRNKHYYISSRFAHPIYNFF